MKFSKKDLRGCLVTGFLTGFIAWRIGGFLGVSEVYGLSLAWLAAIVPVCWVIGVNFGYFLGRFLAFFNQFGRYAAVGFTNAAVDFGVLYLLIWIFEVSGGLPYVIFKTLSFIVAVVHSYFWNKYWVFEAGGRADRAQMVKFFAVNILATIVNVTMAALVVSLVPPAFNLGAEAWAGVGAMAGSATALIFNFVGFRLVVFKK